MGEGILAMSSAERERLVVIGQVSSKVLRQGLAAERLGLCVRQVKRLVRAYRERAILAWFRVSEGGRRIVVWMRA
jgi:hypothetical protein